MKHRTHGRWVSRREKRRESRRFERFMLAVDKAFEQYPPRWSQPFLADKCGTLAVQRRGEQAVVTRSAGAWEDGFVAGRWARFSKFKEAANNTYAKVVSADGFELVVAPAPYMVDEAPCSEARVLIGASLTP